MTAGFRHLGGREQFRGQLIRVETATFAAPDGTTFERDVVRHPGAVSVVPVLDDGETVVLLRQYRAAVDATLLEIPAGKRDVAEEPPEATAARELAEEVGMQAQELALLARFYNSPGFCDELSSVFLATGLSPCASDAQGVEEQHLVVEHVRLASVPDLVARGEICDAKTIIGLTLARARLG